MSTFWLFYFAMSKRRIEKAEEGKAFNTQLTIVIWLSQILHYYPHNHRKDTNRFMASRSESPDNLQNRETMIIDYSQQDYNNMQRQYHHQQQDECCYQNRVSNSSDKTCLNRTNSSNLIQDESLIGEIQKFPCLYNRSHPDYKREEAAQHAWSQIREECVWIETSK